MTFAGPQADAKPFFGAADAFVLPTLYDPLPQRRARSDGVRAAGRHQHASRARPRSSLAHDAGFVCDPRDAIALAAHMRTLLRRRPCARGWAANAPRGDAAADLGCDDARARALYKALLEESVARRKATASGAADRRAALAATRPATAILSRPDEAGVTGRSRRDSESDRMRYGLRRFRARLSARSSAPSAVRRIHGRAPPDKPMTGYHLYRRLLNYVRPYWWAFGIAVAGMVVVAAGDLVMAMLVIPIVNTFQQNDPVRAQVAAARGDRRVPVPRPGLVHLRIRDGVHRAIASCSTCAAR